MRNMLIRLYNFGYGFNSLSISLFCLKYYLNSLLKIKRFIFICLLFIESFAFSQSKKIDSLMLVLKNASNDTVIIKTRIEIAEIKTIFRIGFWDSLKTDLEKLISRNLNNTSLKKFYSAQLAITINNGGYIYQSQGNVTKALEYYEKNLKIQGDIGDKEGEAVTFNNIGYIYEDQ